MVSSLARLVEVSQATLAQDSTVVAISAAATSVAAVDLVGDISAADTSVVAATAVVSKATPSLEVIPQSVLQKPTYIWFCVSSRTDK